MRVVATLCRDELFRGRRPRGLIPAEAVPRHRHAAELHHHVLAASELRDILAPLLEDLVPLAGEGADAKRRAQVIADDRHAAQVIADDRHARERLRELPQRERLRMVVVGVEAEREPPEHGEAFPKLRVLVEAGVPDAGRLVDALTFGPRRAVADAAEQGARGLVGLEHLLHRRAETEVGGPDHGADPEGARRLRCLFGDAVHPLRLPDRPQRLGSVGAVVLTALEVDRLLDVVPSRVRLQVRVSKKW
jgi:hypothetical protein